MRVIEARIQARYLRDDKVTRVEDRCQEFTCIVVRRYYIFQIVIYTQNQHDPPIISSRIDSIVDICAVCKNWSLKETRKKNNPRRVRK